eukprot:scaffold258_cov110-Amphora_coffeaeformis.AAC.4
MARHTRAGSRGVGAPTTTTDFSGQTNPNTENSTFINSQCHQKSPEMERAQCPSPHTADVIIRSIADRSTMVFGVVGPMSQEVVKEELKLPISM